MSDKSQNPVERSKSSVPPSPPPRMPPPRKESK